MGTFRAKGDVANTGGRIRIEVILALLIVVVGGGLFTGTAAAAPVAPVGAALHHGIQRGPAPAVHPLASSIVISYFYASPNPDFQGTPTTFYVGASGGGSPYTYAYTGLPTGCASSNTSALSCTPSINGSAKVAVTVSDPGGNTSQANATLTINPSITSIFFVSNSTFSDQAKLHQLCDFVNSSPFYTSYCYPQSQDPSILNLANGDTGVAYQIYTNSTTSTCPGASDNTTSRVGFSISANTGQNFGVKQTLGNTTCSYLDSLEPSFAVGGSGQVFGAFIEANLQGELPVAYGARTGDALGFVTSTNNGTSFSAVRTLDASGNLARPVVAAFGKTVYIVYENISNSTTTISGGWDPISLHYLYSTDAGATWHGPSMLPGLNAAEGYNAMSPSIAVSANGTVAVAYATNRTCVNTNTSGACLSYGEDVVVVTSTTNGSAWKGPFTVQSALGETTCYAGACRDFLFQSTPQTDVAFNNTGALLFVGWAGTFNMPWAANPWDNYRWTEVGLSESTTQGGSWPASLSTVVQATTPGYNTNYYFPALGVHHSTLYVTYSMDNETIGTDVYDGSLAQWIQPAVVGGTTAFNWSGPPRILKFVKMPYGRLTNFTRHSFAGYGSDLAIDAAGLPLIGYSMPQLPKVVQATGLSYYYVNYTYGTNLSIAFSAQPNTPLVVNLTIDATGLPTGAVWSFFIQGNTITTNASGIRLTNVPKGVEIVIYLDSYNPGYWAVSTQRLTISSPSTFYSDTTVYAEYTILYGYATFGLPAVTPNKSCCTEEFIFGNAYGFSGGGYWDMFFDWESFSYNNYVYNYIYWYTYTSTGSLYGNSWPMYLPYGATFGENGYGYGVPSPSYANGTGPGAYTGPLATCSFFTYCAALGGWCYYYPSCSIAGPIDILSPTNETLWFTNVQFGLTYNESVVASGLPATSTYHFDWDGTPYAGAATAATSVANQTVGLHSITAVWANSTQAGYEYFANVPSSLSVVVPFEPVVNLTFDSLVNLASSLRTVSFHALNISSGTIWWVTFNGTTYSSTTPWINVSTRAGTFSLSTKPVVASDGSSSYTPVGVPSTVTIGSATEYNLSFAPSYVVKILASVGGQVRVGTGTAKAMITEVLLPGQTLEATEVASPGYGFVGWSGQGTGSYTGTGSSANLTASGPIVETANFYPLAGARFNLTFVAVGLPAGVWWTVDLNGVGYSTNLSVLTVPNRFSYSAGPAGLYRLTVPAAYLNETNETRFQPSAVPPVVSTNGSLTAPVAINFTTQYLVSYSSSQGGSVLATYGGIAQTGSSTWVTSGTQITLQAQRQSGYHFLGWNGTGMGSFTGTSTTAVVAPLTPVSEVATFQAIPAKVPSRYTLELTLASPLVAGTVWSAVVNGQGYSSSGPSLNVTGLLAGNYSLAVNQALSPDGLTQYRGSSANPTSVSVLANTSQVVAYSTYYWVSVSGSSGGTVGPKPGWYASGAVLSLNATPDSGMVFIGWNGTGSGSYSGAEAQHQIQVKAPLNEVASFAPPRPTATTSTSFWAATSTWAILGVVGLLAGLVIGLLVFRGRRPPTAGPTEVPPSSPVVEPMEAAPPVEAPAYSEETP